MRRRKTCAICLLFLVFCGQTVGLRFGAPIDSWHAPGGVSSKLWDGGGGGGNSGWEQPAEEQCFPWSLTSSIAREDLEYPDDRDGSHRVADAGDVIPLQCDSVVCPNPRVANCYMNDGVCGEGEWCMLEDQIRFGPWAMGAEGETPNLKGRTCGDLKAAGFRQLFDMVCGSHTNWGPWLAVRGRCVRYRQVDESCNAYFVGSDTSLGPQYAVNSRLGSPPKRPLLCAPGLVCTGDVEPLPHTCVKARPPDVCYQGPWWDSTSWCKQRGSGGLSRSELEQAAAALILQLPVEAFSPFDEAFWTDSAAQRARSIILNILEVLWPDAYRSQTNFPLAFPSPKGAPGSKEWNATAAEVVHTMHQANKVWSTIHTLIHNTGSPMSRQQVDASRSLAVWLRQHFFCCNCRGFWSSEVLNGVGLPPDSSEREAHKRWWWMAHNMASEHSAATRGGHPWIYPGFAKDSDFAAEFGRFSPHLKCQNPWFLPWEAAEDMWAIRGGSQ